MKTAVVISWDKPEDINWLTAENIKMALSDYCRNTKFNVEELKNTTIIEKKEHNYIISWAEINYYDKDNKPLGVDKVIYEKEEEARKFADGKLEILKDAKYYKIFEERDLIECDVVLL